MIPRKAKYASTFANFVTLSRDKKRLDIDGASVVIDPEGAPVAEQLWSSVQNVTTYSKALAKSLLKTLGVLEADVSPFCRTFESLADLKDEYVKYQARNICVQGQKWNWSDRRR